MINGVPSFRGFYMTEKGRESLKTKPIDFIENDLVPTAQIAKKDEKNTLSVEDNGRIYIETPQYGKFTVNNPACSEVNGRYFSCDVRTLGDDVERIHVPFKSEAEAKKFENENFGIGAYIPRMNLDLYKAIVAADAYKASLINEL